MDLGAGPSRPPPIPYDDPYADDFGMDKSNTEPKSSTQTPSGAGSGHANRPSAQADFGRSPNQGRGRGHGRPDNRPGQSGGGRGRGRGQGRGGRGRGTGGSRRSSEGDVGWSDRHMAPSSPNEQYDPQVPRPLSPTSLAIARATGQLSTASSPSSLYSPGIPIPPTSGPFFQHQQQQQMHPYNFIPQGYPQQYVQPHINPRFASNFGMGFMPPTRPRSNSQYGHYGTTTGLNQPNWTDEWTVRTSQPDSSATEGGHDDGSDQS
jgi:H/ACA ribonucleoprotein complex non-core subunit NAF1